MEMGEIEEALATLRNVRDDRESGASQLFERTLNAIYKLCSARPSRQDLEEALQIIRESHPPMTPLRTIERVVEGTLESLPLQEAVERLRSVSWRLLKYKGECLRGICRAVSRELKADVIFTLSYSSTVFHTLMSLKEKNRSLRVVVAESLPGGEGRKLSRHLRARGIASTVIPDSAMASGIKNSDVILLGVDTMTREGGVVNKLGSYTAALVAKALNRRVYVLLEPYKIAPWQKGGNPASTMPEVEPPLFEYVPPDMIDYAVICENVVRPNEEEILKVYRSFLEELEIKDILNRPIYRCEAR